VTVVRCSAAHYRVPREVWWPASRIGASLYEIDHARADRFEVETETASPASGFTYTVGHGGARCSRCSRTRSRRRSSARPARGRGDLARLHARAPLRRLVGVTAVAIAAADIALWDARVRGRLPLYRYLGAHRDELPAYASAVNLALTTDELVEQMAGYAGEGVPRAEDEGRHDPARGRRARRAVREGGRRRVRADGRREHGVGRRRGRRRLRALEPFGLAWLEEPLPPHDVPATRRSSGRTSIPLAAGETLFAPHEFTPYFASGAIRIPQPGRRPSSASRLAARRGGALDAGLPLAPHFMPEIHVHLACAVPQRAVARVPADPRASCSRRPLGDSVAGKGASARTARPRNAALPPKTLAQNRAGQPVH
jgi:L-alanine-DL-glutamate epimerase-like enolase superfamily enzyme